MVKQNKPLTSSPLNLLFSSIFYSFKSDDDVMFEQQKIFK